MQASPLGAMLAEATGAGTDRAGHIEVLPDCTLPEHPEVFVVGDMMSLNGLPGVAEVAMQSGIHAARTIKRRLGGDATAKPFVYRDLGSMATISRFRAIVSFKGIKVGGFIGWLMWAFVHLTFLTGFKNRVDRAVQVARRVRGQLPGRAHDHDAAGLRPARRHARPGSNRARKTSHGSWRSEAAPERTRGRRLSGRTEGRLTRT